MNPALALLYFLLAWTAVGAVVALLYIVFKALHGYWR